MHFHIKSVLNNNYVTCHHSIFVLGYSIICIVGMNTTSDNSKWLYETILKYHEWYLCQISCTNPGANYLRWLDWIFWG